MRFLTVALLFAAVPATAQVPQARTWWAFVSLGPGGAADSGFYASGVGAAWQRGSKLYMARVASLDTKTQKRISDAGFLVGVSRRPTRFQLAFAGGIGVVKDSRDSTALAMPFEAQGTWILSDVFAIGLRTFASINRLENFGGTAVTVHLGRIRR